MFGEVADTHAPASSDGDADADEAVDRIIAVVNVLRNVAASEEFKALQARRLHAGLLQYEVPDGVLGAIADPSTHDLSATEQSIHDLLILNLRDGIPGFELKQFLEDIRLKGQDAFTAAFKRKGHIIDGGMLEVLALFGFFGELRKLLIAVRCCLVLHREHFSVTVRKLSGDVVVVIAPLPRDVGELKRTIYLKCGITPAQQKLLKGDQVLGDEEALPLESLELSIVVQEPEVDSESVSSYESYSVPFHVGSFAPHMETPGIRWLYGHSTPSKSEVHDLIHSLGGRLDANFTSCPQARILNTGEMSLLMNKADRCFAGQKDFKLELTIHDLTDLIGTQAVQNLSNRFPGTIFDQIKLRRCAAHGSCIGFHIDSVFNARLTMQVPLNDESDYVGGQLMFATSQGLRCPLRPAGSVTVHDGEIVHGVSCLKSGVRYGLYLSKAGGGGKHVSDRKDVVGTLQAVHAK